MPQNLTVAIPALNEGKTIHKVIDEVLKLPRVAELILVNDGSKDNTLDIMNDFATKDSRVKVINNSVNRGKGFSMRAAINVASKEYFIVQDADLELDPKSIELLFTKMEQSGADLVNGNRDLDNKNVKRISKFASMAIPILVYILFGRKINDVVCGYKLMSTEKYRTLNLNTDRFEIETEIIVKAIKKKYKIAEQKVPFTPRGFAEGKHVRWSDGLKVLKLLLRFKFNKNYQ